MNHEELSAPAPQQAVDGHAEYAPGQGQLPVYSQNGESPELKADQRKDASGEPPLDDIPPPVVEPRKGLAGVGLIFACGMALFSDGYVNNASGAVVSIFEIIYSGKESESEEDNFESRFSALVFAGTVVGMLVFGVLVDRVGRKFGMIFASIWLSFLSVIISGSWGVTHNNRGSLFAQLEAFRFLQGLAIGAEYPSGSVAAAENSESSSVKSSRQQMYFIWATNTMIDIGFIIAPLVATILYYIFGPGHLDWVWRLTLGLGAIPPLLVLPWRLVMRESEHYRRGAIKKNVPWLLIFRKYGIRLIATCLVWFVYDYVSYPSSIFSGMFIRQVNGGEDLGKTLGWQTLLTVWYLPGTFGGAFISQAIGPKYTMILGSALQGVLAFIMAGLYPHLKHNVGGTIVVYGLFLMFGEIGLGNNLGLVASKVIGPTAVRGTLYGIAAAIGKVGAFSGSYAYPQIREDLGGKDSNLGNEGPFYIAGSLAFFACVLVALFIPPVRMDGMNQEDEVFLQYLREHNYDFSNIGADEKEFGRQDDKKHGDAVAAIPDAGVSSLDYHA